MKLVVSLTVHEEPQVVQNQVENILTVMEADYIVIHVNSMSNNVYNDVVQIFSSNHGDNQRVFINDKRCNTSKDSYSLHNAHYLNYIYLEKNNIDYDYFLLEASNSLCITKGAKSYISQYDLGFGKGALANYWRDKVLAHESFIEFASVELNLDKSNVPVMLLKGCHEGSYYKKEIVSKIFSFIERLDNFCREKKDFPNYPTEEIWFQLAVISLNLKQQASDTLTYLPWHKNLTWTKSEVEDILNGVVELRSGKFSIKRIERKSDDSIRKLLSNHYKY